MEEMNFKYLFDKRQLLGFWLGVTAFLLILIFPFSSVQSINYMTAVTVLMVLWWITEALPLGATSLVPLVALPIFGIIAGNEVAREYFNSTIMIFIGGFMIAIAMQKWMLHKRISLLIINILGSSTSGIILGFMCASAIISMFISNVATTVMLLPIGLAFISELEEEYSVGTVHNFSVSIMLGIAYCASIGGVATLIGTAPNLIFRQIYEMNFPELEKITFAGWLSIGLPISITMLLLTWVLFTRFLFRVSDKLVINKEIIKEQLRKLGKITYQEKTVLSIFLTTVFLWLFRVPIDMGFVVIPGWSQLLGNTKFVDDGTVAIFAGLLLMIIPAKSSVEEKKILNIDVLSQIPWEVILIFGGGFALAKGFTDSGLSAEIGKNFSNMNDLPPIMMTIGINFFMTFITELTSNTATTNTVLPIIASIAKSNNIDPLILMLPATISASFAFMLPVGTPPNAIVYGSGKINIIEMIKAGIILNLIGVVVVSAYFLVFVIL